METLISEYSTVTERGTFWAALMWQVLWEDTGGAGRRQECLNAEEPLSVQGHPLGKQKARWRQTAKGHRQELGVPMREQVGSLNATL